MTPLPLGHFTGPLAELVPAHEGEPLYIRKALPDITILPPWLRSFFGLVDRLNEDIRNGVPFPFHGGPPRPLTALAPQDAAREIARLVELETAGQIQFLPETSINIREGEKHG